MKKVILSLMLFILLTATLLASPCGDIDSNNKVTIVDALLLAQYSVGSNPSKFNKEVADVNGDKNINIIDALLIAQFYVGLRKDLNGCAPTQSAKPSIVTIYPIGDSITEAIDTESAWRYWLWKALTEAGHKNLDFVGSMNGTHRGKSSPDPWDMDHDGHWGWTAEQILTRSSGNIKKWAPQYKGQIAIIFLGTNDIRKKSSTSKIMNTFKSIIDELRKTVPTVKIILCQLPYWNYKKYSGNDAGVDAFNKALLSLTQYGPVNNSPIKIVDLGSNYDWTKEHKDGIHPNTTGAKKISQRLFPVIDAWLR